MKRKIAVLVIAFSLPVLLFGYYHMKVEGTITRIYKQKRTRGKIFWLAAIENEGRVYILKLLPVDICTRPAFKVGDRVVAEGVVPRIFLSQRVPLILVYRIFIKTTGEEFVLRNRYGRINWVPARMVEFYGRVKKIILERGSFSVDVKWVTLLVQKKGDRAMVRVRLCPYFTCSDPGVKEGDLVKVRGYFPPYPEGQEKPPVMACTVEDKTSRKILKVRDCKTRRPFWLREMR